MTPDDYLLPIMSIIIILIFGAWIVWYYEQNRFPTEQTTGLCPVGQCATNIYSGKKVCPDISSDSVNFTIGLEVCNPPQACTNSKTPFALQPNLGTDPGGVCTDGDCRCLSQVQCPEYITSFFQSESNRPFQPLDTSRLILQQKTTYVDQAGILQNIPPFSISELGTQFCAVPVQWVDRIYPRTCLNGTLAFSSPNPSAVTLASANDLPVTCVAGTPCASGNAVWNTSEDILQCIQICPPNKTLILSPQTKRLVCETIGFDDIIP